ncbi:MAG TPA: serine/threonine transporter SstT, partial [Thauera sp.]|nr:serine/threonine transporter SstT [Thauera sp.]
MTTASPTAFQRLMRMSLISQIAIGLVLGVVLALVAPGATKSVALLGDLFISALKAVAPVLVFVLVAAAIANHKHGQPTHIRPVLVLYLLGTFAAALVAVLASFAFPTTLVLDAPAASGNPPGGILLVLKNLLL